MGGIRRFDRLTERGTIEWVEWVEWVEWIGLVAEPEAVGPVS